MSLTKKDLSQITRIFQESLEINVAPKLDEMKGDIIEMKGDIIEIKEDIHDIKEDIIVLKRDVSGLKADRELDISFLKEDINELKKDMKIVKDDIKLQKGDTNMLRADINSVKIGMGVFESEMKESFFRLSEKIDENAANIAYSHKIYASKDDLKAVDARVRKLELARS